MSSADMPMAPGAVAVTIVVDQNGLGSYTDSFLATAWHVAQANPAPFSDKAAGDLVERIGREIIRRWLARVEPELWHHQGRHYEWNELRKLARYQPGGPAGTPEWERGTWVPKTGDDTDLPGASDDVDGTGDERRQR